jgi:hypothetical protein
MGHIRCWYMLKIWICWEKKDTTKENKEFPADANQKEVRTDNTRMYMSYTQNSQQNHNIATANILRKCGKVQIFTEVTNKSQVYSWAY